MVNCITVANEFYAVNVFNLYNRNCLVAYSFKKTGRVAHISIFKEYLYLTINFQRMVRSVERRKNVRRAWRSLEVQRQREEGVAWGYNQGKNSYWSQAMGLGSKETQVWLRMESANGQQDHFEGKTCCNALRTRGDSLVHDFEGNIQCVNNISSCSSFWGKYII